MLPELNLTDATDGTDKILKAIQWFAEVVIVLLTKDNIFRFPDNWRDRYVWLLNCRAEADKRRQEKLRRKKNIGLP